MDQTVLVYAGLRDGKPFQESIPAKKLALRQYQILASPGFANGFANGDVLELIDEDGHFRVIKRAGNVCVQIFFKGDKDETIQEFGWRFGALDGWLDGGFNGKETNLLIYTIPYNTGFAAIEDVFKELPPDIALSEWMYGNIYAEDGAPLNWWVSKE